MKNPYHRPNHRQAFDLVVKLIQSGQTDYREIAKQLDHSITREQRLKIAAKICNRHGIKPPLPPKRTHIEDIATANRRGSDCAGDVDTGHARAAACAALRDGAAW